MKDIPVRVSVQVGKWKLSSEQRWSERSWTSVRERGTATKTLQNLFIELLAAAKFHFGETE